jgi:hypothetical protein
VGINIDEIEAYLRGKGVLEVESPVTAHVKAAQAQEADAST